MPIPDFDPSETAPGIVTVERSAARVIASMVRDPLSALPPGCYHERMVLTHNFGQLRAYVSDPALIHELLVRNAEALDKTKVTKQALGPLLGEGLLTADGGAWRWQRQTLAPAFRHDELSALLPAMIAAAETTRDRWLALPDGATIDVGREMMRTTFEIILETMLSGSKDMDAGEVEGRVTDLLGAASWTFAMALLKAPAWLPFPGKRRAEAATRFMRRTVETRIAARRAAAGGARDLVGMLLDAVEPETGRRMSDREIADNILTFVIAGHETTAVALGWTFGLLAGHPEVVARLRAEIDNVTGGGPVRPAHVAALTYARRVISEAMRLYPPAPLIARTCRRGVQVESVAFPAGSIVFVPIWAIHRHASLWPRPDVFDPDRFGADEARGRHRFAYMPFGAGPRICIGSAFAMIEAVAILAVLIKATTLARIDRDLPQPRMQLTLRPRTPLRMRLSRAGLAVTSAGMPDCDPQNSQVASSS